MLHKCCSDVKKWWRKGSYLPSAPWCSSGPGVWPCSGNRWSCLWSGCSRSDAGCSPGHSSWPLCWRSWWMRFLCPSPGPLLGARWCRWTGDLRNPYGQTWRKTRTVWSVFSGMFSLMLLLVNGVKWLLDPGCGVGSGFTPVGPTNLEMRLTAPLVVRGGKNSSENQWSLDSILLRIFSLNLSDRSASSTGVEHLELSLELSPPLLLAPLESVLLDCQPLSTLWTWFTMMAN